MANGDDRGGPMSGGNLGGWPTASAAKAGLGYRKPRRGVTRG